MRCVACNTILDNKEMDHPCGCCRRCIRESKGIYVHTRDHRYEHENVTETFSNYETGLDNQEDML